MPAEEFEALTATFVEQHRVLWNAFVKKIREDNLMDAFRQGRRGNKGLCNARTLLARARRKTQKAVEGWKGMDSLGRHSLIATKFQRQFHRRERSRE